MAAQKKIIKADTAEMMDAKIEKVDFTSRRFNDNVFKDIEVDEDAVKYGTLQEDNQAKSDQEEAGGEVEIEPFYSDSGELTGLRVTCKCGEVIELEFASD